MQPKYGNLEFEEPLKSNYIYLFIDLLEFLRKKL